MNRRPGHIIAALSRRQGFTLVEMMVSLVVLVLLMAMMVQLTTGAASVLRQTGQHLDSDTAARLIFNRMEIDFAKMMKRTDLDYASFKQPGNLQAGNDKTAFFAEASGYFSGASQPSGSNKSGTSLVAYMIANDTYNATPALQRMGKGLGWEPDSSGSWSNVPYLPVTLASRWSNLFGNDPDYKTVGDQVFRIEYTYLLKATNTQPARLSLTPWDTTANTSINGFQDVAAIVVAIAVLDPTSRKLVSDYTALTAALPDAQDPTTDTTYHGDVAAAWNAAINQSGFANTVGIPKMAAANVRVYERYFYLDSPK